MVPDSHLPNWNICHSHETFKINYCKNGCFWNVNIQTYAEYNLSRILNKYVYYKILLNIHNRFSTRINLSLLRLFLSYNQINPQHGKTYNRRTNHRKNTSRKIHNSLGNQMINLIGHKIHEAVHIAQEK